MKRDYLHITDFSVEEIFEFLDLSRIFVHQIISSLSLILDTDLRLVDL